MKSTIIILIMGLMLSPAPTMAKEKVTKSHYFIGAGFGTSNIQEIADLGNDGLTIKQGLAWKCMWGLDINEHFTLEQSYGQQANVTASADDIMMTAKVKGLITELVIKSPVESIFTPYVKLGLAVLTEEIKSINYSYQENYFVYGVGASVDLGNYTLRLEHQTIEMDDPLEQTLISVTFNF